MFLYRSTLLSTLPMTFRDTAPWRRSPSGITGRRPKNSSTRAFNRVGSPRHLGSVTASGSWATPRASLTRATSMQSGPPVLKRAPNQRLKLTGLLFKGIGRSLAGDLEVQGGAPCARRHVARLSAIR
jgi:hypothetical protein